MPKVFGSQAEFQIVIADPKPGEMESGHRTVEIYGAGRWLTCDDNTVKVPHFPVLIGCTLSRLLTPGGLEFPYPGLSAEETHRRLLEGGNDVASFSYRFLNWGPTTDNVSSHIFRRRADVVLTFSFWRESHPYPNELGMVFVTEMPERDLLQILHEAEMALFLGQWYNAT